MIVGYTAGVFDLFHIGHVNLLRNAKSMCDHLIVGVTTDELAEEKKTKPVIPFCERIEVVRACKYVDVAIPQKDISKLKAYCRLEYDKLFVGDDWYGNDKWNKYQNLLKAFDVEVIYFPYTEGTSSTLINDVLKRLRNE